MFLVLAFLDWVCYNINKFDKSVYAYRRWYAKLRFAFLGAIFCPLGNS